MPLGHDQQQYVLVEHQAKPAEKQVRWTYHYPTFGEQQVCLRAMRATESDEERGQAFLLERLAMALDAAQGLSLRGQPAVVPPLDDMDGRRVFVAALPFRWVRELGEQVDKASDLDPEEE